jgi:prophage DNA circulation protein
MKLTAMDKMLPCSFAGIAFPVESVEIRGAYRTHTHEYLYTPGGDVEKLGRRLYEFQIQANFQDTFRTYPGLYPNGLARLMRLIETGESFPLVVPNVGTITAVCTAWDRSLVARCKSGERVRFSFLEHQDQAFLVENVVAEGSAVIQDRLSVAADIFSKKAPDIGLLDSIENAASAVLAVADQAEMMSNLVEAKLLALTSLCEQADASLEILNDPAQHEVLDALLGLWSAAEKLHTDVLKLHKPVQTFVVPATMGVMQVAAKIFNGSTDRAMELLQLNAFQDLTAIPEGTQVRYAA